MSVDLPAPLAPTSACTSPRSAMTSTPSSATTAPKRLPRPRTSSSGAVNPGASLRLELLGQLARPPVVGLGHLGELGGVLRSDVLRRDDQAARDGLAVQDLQAELGRLLAGPRRARDGAARLVLDDPLHPAVVL